LPPAPDIARIRQATSAELAQIVANELPSPAWTLVQKLRDEAGTYYNTDAAEARCIAERAIELAELIGEPRALGWGLRTMAEALLYSGRMRDAEEFYDRATQAWRREKAHEALGQLLVGRIHVLSLLGHHDRIPAMAKEARGYLTAANDEVYLAKLAVSLGNAHFQRDAYGPALEEYDNALEIFQRMSVRDELVLSLGINRAVGLTHLHRDQEGLSLYEQLEAEAGEDGFELLQAQIRMNAAHVQAQRAEFEGALRRLPQATNYFRQTNHPAFLASCLLNRAEIYHQLNLHSNALELAEEAAQLFADEGLTYDEALALSQGSLTHLALGQYEEALPRIDRAETLFAQDENTPRAAQMHLISGEALFLQKRFDHAEAHFKDALQTFRTLELHRWEAAACVLGARVFVSRYDDRSVVATDTMGTNSRVREGEALIEQLRQCLVRLPETIYPLQRYRVLEALGELLLVVPRASDTTSTSAKPDAAIESPESVFREALSCLEDVRVRVPTEDSKIAFLEDKTHLYDRLITLEIARHEPDNDRIFEWMERARAQSLWDRLRSPRTYLASADVGTDTSEMEETRKHLSWLHSRLSQLELGTAEERVQAVALRGQLAQTEESWARMLRERTEISGIGVASSAGRALRLDAIRQCLPAGWGWISYHIGDGFSLALIVTRDGVERTSLRADLAACVTSLCNRLDFQWGAAALSSVRKGSVADAPAKPPSLSPHDFAVSRPPGRTHRSGHGQRPHEMLQATTDAILTELYELLWQPLVDIGAPSGLNWVVSPHGPIHRVPIHALRGPSGYLVEEMDIALSPSARVWHELPRSKPLVESDGDSNSPPDPTASSRPARTAWVSGVPSTQLPAVQIEVDRVGRHLSHMQVVKDLRPTHQSFIAEAPRADLIHLAAHGSLRKDNPAFSYVELTDGPLFVHDLSSLQLRPSTVVLTACSSARGSAPAGDEWIGLARGFLQAGANTVVASLWPIQDQPTLELMDLFYLSFRQGYSAPVALGRAMRTLLRTRPHPWHWASFAVLGGVATDGPPSPRDPSE